MKTNRAASKSKIPFDKLIYNDKIDIENQLYSSKSNCDRDVYPGMG